MSHYSSWKSSKILLLRGKIKGVAYHRTFGMARPHVVAMSYPHCDLQFAGGRRQELLRDGCQRCCIVQSNTSQVGPWLLRHIHSYSISCLPILEQNLRLYQKKQEVTFITIPPDPYLSPVRPPFPHLGSSTIFQIAAPCNESSSLAPLTARIALHPQTSYLWTTLKMITSTPIYCWYNCSCSKYSPDAFLPHLEIFLVY